MSDRLTSSPVPTANQLKDIIDWLKEGDCVFIHNNFLGGRFFHPNCVCDVKPDKSIFNSCRVIYINVKKMPGLLDDGEWNWYINNSGFHECQCGLRELAGDISIPSYAYKFNS